MPTRPKHLNLMQIRLPLPALLSILHRVSGALLFLALPLLLCWLQSSLSSAESYDHMTQAFSYVPVKLISLVLLWGYFHHLCAGIRHIFLDLDIGTDLACARFSTVLSFGVSIALTVIVGAMLW